MVKHTLLIVLQLRCLSLSMGNELWEGLDMKQLNPLDPCDQAGSTFPVDSGWMMLVSFLLLFTNPKNPQKPELLIESVKI